MALRTLIKLFETANPLYANAVVSFYTVDDDGEKTTTLATLYDADNGTGFVTNPVTLSPDGRFPTPAYTTVAVIGSIVAAVNVDDHDTGIFYPIGGATGDWATATLYYPNDIFRAGASADASYDVYAVKMRHTSGVFATDLAAGRVQKLVDVSDIASLLTLGTITPAWQTVTDDGTIAIGLETIRTALAAKTAPAIDDEFLIRDTVGTTGKRMTFENYLKVINALTTETALALADVFAFYDNSAAAIRKMTPDNLFKVLNLFTEDTSPDGSNDFLLEYDTSAGTVKKVKPSNILTTTAASIANLPYFNFLSGFTLSNNASDANNDIDIAAGQCMDSTNTTIITGADITKRLDASWQVGSNQGGLDTGSEANSTWYHVWAIKRTDTGVVDVLFSASATAPTMPSGYDRKRRLGAVRNNGSGNILAFHQYGDRFYLDTPLLDISASSPGTAAVSRTLTTPLGVKTRALLNAAYLANTFAPGANFNAGWYLSSLDAVDVAASTTAVPLGSVLGSISDTADQIFGSYIEVMTNTSSQIRSRATYSDAAVIVRLATLGWVDERGRLG